MPTYQKAYPLERLRRFGGWQEIAAPASGEIAGDTLVFLQEDLAVRMGCFESDEVLASSDRPDWATFCAEDLGFAVPDWEAESQRVRAKLAAEQLLGS